MCTKALALGLVLFLAVGCDDQGIPTEASIPALDVPTPRPAVVFNDWFPGSVELWDGTGTGSVVSNCGEWIRVESERDHVIVKETVTPSGNYKYSFHISSLGCRENVGAMVVSRHVRVPTGSRSPPNAFWSIPSPPRTRILTK